MSARETSDKSGNSDGAKPAKMDRARPASARQARNLAIEPDALFDFVREPLLVLDPGLRVQRANPAFCRAFGVAEADVEDSLLGEIDHGSWNVPELRAFLEQVLAGSPPREHLELRHTFERIGRRVLRLHARRLPARGRSDTIILLAIDDLTERELVQTAEHHAADEAHRLAAIIDSSADAIIGQALDGTITSWNRGAQAMFGFTAAEAIGRRITLICPEDRLHEIDQALEQIHRGEPVPALETRRVRKDGREIDVSVMVSPVFDAAGRVVGASAIDRDNSRRMQAERALRESEQRFRIMTDALPALISYVDADRRYQFNNAAYERWFGISREDCRGRHLRDVLGEAAYELIKPRVDAALAGVSLSFEDCIPYAAGGDRAVHVDYVPHRNEHGDVVGYYALIADVTESKRLTEALRVSEARFREAIDHYPGVFVLYDAQRRFRHVNHRGLQLSERPLREMVGRTDEELWPPDIVEGYLPLLQRAAETGLPQAGEVQLRLPAGAFTHVVNYVPLVDGHGRVREILGITHDVTERKRAEVALRREHEFRRRLLETMQAIVLMLDTQGRIVWFNRYLEELSGYSLPAVQGKDWFDTFLPEGDRPRIRRLFQRASGGKRTRGNVNALLTKEGLEREVEWYDTVLTDDAGRVTHVLSTGQDVTERRQAERSLRENETFIRTVLGSLTAHIAVLDGEGRILAVNSAWEKFARENGDPQLQSTGVGTNYLQVCRQVIDSDPIAAEALAGIESVMAGLVGEFSLEYPCHSPDRQRWFLMRVTPLVRDGGRGAVVSNIDITRRIRAEEALKEREDSLRAIVETAADGIVTIDARGRILTFNAAAEKMFGYRSEEAVGRNVSLLMPSPYREEHDGYLADYRETGRRRIIGSVRELVGQRKDGSILPIELAVSEIDHRMQFTGIIRDISERKHLQEQLLTIAEQEQRRIGQDLHDDVGQELAGLGLLADTLAEALEERSAPETELASRIAVRSQRALHKTRLLSRGLIPVEVDRQGLMSALAELASRTCGLDHVRCHFECEEPVLVHENPTATHLYRIAQEAVNNALRHAEAREIHIGLRTDGNLITLAVSDDGSGIPDELRERGMGLRIMRYRAQLIGGTLTIGPGPERGTQVMCSVVQGALK